MIEFIRIVCLFIYLSFIYLFVCLFIYYLFVYLSFIYSFIDISIYLLFIIFIYLVIAGQLFSHHLLICVFL